MKKGSICPFVQGECIGPECIGLGSRVIPYGPLFTTTCGDETDVCQKTKEVNYCTFFGKEIKKEVVTCENM